MAKSEIRDMTTGSPFRLILGFAVPMLMGLLFQQFYSMVDTIIVGKYLGVSALASVGSTSSINFMIIGFCTGVCSGFSIPVAQRFGAGDHHGLRCFVANAGWLSAIFSTVMTVIVCFLCMDILRWMDTPDDIIQGAYDYIFIIFAGIPVTYLYNILAGIIRSLGDSRTPVYFLLLSSVINIFLDLFTILVMGMGVEGAAYATVISQAISGVLCFLYMRSHFPILRMTREERKFNLRMAKILCGIGVPMGLQYSITAIGSVILQTAVNALGATMATWAGQNVGAGKIDRVKEGVKYALLIGCVYAVAAFVILTLFSKYLALLFLDADEVSTIGNVSLFLFGNSLFYIALVFVNVVRFSIQGMGFSTFAILAGVFEMFARTFAGMCLVPIFGYPAACFASPMAWIAADIFLVPAFLHCIKRLKSASPVI